MNEITLTLKSAYCFSDGLELLYENPDIKPEDDDLAVVIIDRSGSMHKRQTEMKLIISAIKCMTKTSGWNVPESKGPTALIDSVNEVVGENPSRVKRVIIISDGDDNKSKKQKLIHAILQDGSPEYRDLPDMPLGYVEYMNVKRGPGEKYDSYDTYKHRVLHQRREAVVRHIDNIGAEVFVVGVGNEVKDFINLCASAGSKINTALVETSATAEDIGAVMTTVIKNSRSKSASKKKTVTSENADRLPDEDVVKLNKECQRTTSHSDRRLNMKLLNDGPQFDPARQSEYVSFIVNHEAKKNDLSVESVAAIVDWFRSIVVSQAGSPVAGALIGGRLYPRDKNGRRNGPVFDVPNDEIKPSAWTNTFTRILELLSREPSWILSRVEGLAESFHDDFEANRVGPVFAEVGFPATFIAITKNHLPQVSNVLYYKFKGDTYPHFVLNHRASSAMDDCIPWSLMSVLKSLPVVFRGNSGANSYGGPVIEEVAEEEAVDALSGDMQSEDGETSSVTGETSSVEGSCEVSLLKRKIDVLEEANEQLRKKIDTLEGSVKGLLESK